MKEALFYKKLKNKKVLCELCLVKRPKLRTKINTIKIYCGYVLNFKTHRNKMAQK